MASTLEGFGKGLCFCDKSHVHGPSSGKDKHGRYVSARLATYPSKLCFLIAEAVLTTLFSFRKSGGGPTGWMRGELPIRRITQWTRTAEGTKDDATAFLNETCLSGKGVVLSEAQTAIYMHVDDTAAVACGRTVSAAQSRSSALMRKSAGALIATGFGVTDQRAAVEGQRIVGYEVEQSPARLRAPAVKALQIRGAFYFLASRHDVAVDVLRALVGVWLWMALLRRELLSIPQAVFKLTNRHEGEVVPWWPTARREVLAMARTIGALYSDVGAPLSSTMMATDAMGADGSTDDLGGFGIVAGNVPQALALDCLKLGARPGKALHRDMMLEGRRNPDAPITRTTPFTLLLGQLFDDTTEWQVLAQGRWQWLEHITAGEMRAVLRLLRIMASCHRCHRSKIISLQDNLAVAALLAKGRSSAPLLNFLLRRRTAYCLFAELLLIAPWGESGKQTADESSRNVDGASRA